MKKALIIIVLVDIFLFIVLMILLLPSYLDEYSYKHNILNIDLSKVDESSLDEHGYIKGSYYKWRDNDSFTYKSYTGTPSLDSEEFYGESQNEGDDIIDQTEYGYCDYYPHTYPELSARKLKRLAKTDPLATFDLLSRDLVRSKDFHQFNANLAKAKHLTAIAYTYSIYDVSDDDDLDKYFDIAPIALFVQYERDEVKKNSIQLKRNKDEITPKEFEILSKEHNEKMIDLLYKLKNADNSWLMALSVEELYEATGEIDKDVLCEAYYRGCYFLYDLKIEHNVKCSD